MKTQTIFEHYYPQEILKSIQAARVGMAGCGGIGSNVAVGLARSGFRQFVLADFDKVEQSNLNRQYYFTRHLGIPKPKALSSVLAEINSDIEVKCYFERLTRETCVDLFTGCDVVVEAFDNVESKVMLTEIYLNSPKLYVCCSGMAGYGNANAIAVRKVGENTYIVGDEKTPVSAEMPPFAPRVAMCAAMMADVILSRIASQG